MKKQIYAFAFLMGLIALPDKASAGGFENLSEEKLTHGKVTVVLDGPNGEQQCVGFSAAFPLNHLNMAHRFFGKEPVYKTSQVTTEDRIVNFSSVSEVLGGYRINVSPTDALIKIDDKLIELSDGINKLPVGLYQIAAYKDGFFTYGQSLKITPCGVAEVNITLLELPKAQQTKPQTVSQKQDPVKVEPQLQAEEVLSMDDLQKAITEEIIETHEIAADPSPVQQDRVYITGDKFKDCETCPEMVVVPEGNFVMGTNDTGFAKDAPARPVVVEHSFAVSTFEITFSQWDACVSDGGCNAYSPDDEGWGRLDRPVIHVSWQDVQEYLNWLTQKTEYTYRLLSEAEWEYVARAGTDTDFWWGDDKGFAKANCANCETSFSGDKTAPVGTFAANSFGVHDTVGNVWEWVEDCYDKDSYVNHNDYPAPYVGEESCKRVLRGGAWDLISAGAKASFRFNADPGLRSNAIGLRVARDLN